MFINNSEQCDWIRQQFETPGAMELSKGDKVLAWTRLLRAHKYVLQNHSICFSARVCAWVTCYLLSTVLYILVSVVPVLAEWM